MFIFDGNPNGRIMCELSNWNGRVYNPKTTFFIFCKLSTFFKYSLLLSTSHWAEKPIFEICG